MCLVAQRALNCAQTLTTRLTRSVLSVLLSGSASGESLGVTPDSPRMKRPSQKGTYTEIAINSGRASRV